MIQRDANTRDAVSALLDAIRARDALDAEPRAVGVRPMQSAGGARVFSPHPPVKNYQKGKST